MNRGLFILFMKRGLLYSVTVLFACTSLFAAEKKVNGGGINDLNAIGNRNIGCGRGVGNWYSLDKQIAMGREYSQQVEQQARLINDPVITEYVNRIGQNLVRNSDSQVPFTIKVVDDDTANAFALPGGYFYVNSGLLLAADNEAEVAGVMAHEIAHVAACHIAREQSRAQLANLASIPLIFVGGGIGYAIQQAAGLAVPMSFLKFSRGFESEADYLGIEYMYKAGYDPQAFTAFMEKVNAMEKNKPGFVSKAFSTHPQTPDRVEKSQKEVATLLPPRDEYKLDTSEFQDVKARLGALETKHKIDKPGDSHPTLRRRTPDDTASTKSPSDTNNSETPSRNSDDGPPVLHRRDQTPPQ